jgi:hypothetical protein
LWRIAKLVRSGGFKKHQTLGEIVRVQSIAALMVGNE